MRDRTEDPKAILDAHPPHYPFDADDAPRWYVDWRPALLGAEKVKPSSEDESEKVTFRHYLGVAIAGLIVAVVILLMVVWALIILRPRP